MATYRFRAHNGLTAGKAHTVRTHVYNLVQMAAVGVSWNRMGMAPAGFTMTQVGSRNIPVHAKTGIAFKAGFLMHETAGNQKWEGHAIEGPLRLDLQSINNGWANWAVQTNGANSVTVATCLMAVDKCFSQNQLAHALIQSAHQNLLCQLTQ